MWLRKGRLSPQSSGKRHDNLYTTGRESPTPNALPNTPSYFLADRVDQNGSDPSPLAREDSPDPKGDFTCSTGMMATGGHVRKQGPAGHVPAAASAPAWPSCQGLIFTKAELTLSELK